MPRRFCSMNLKCVLNKNNWYFVGSSCCSCTSLITWGMFKLFNWYLVLSNEQINLLGAEQLLVPGVTVQKVIFVAIYRLSWHAAYTHRVRRIALWLHVQQSGCPKVFKWLIKYQVIAKTTKWHLISMLIDIKFVLTILFYVNKIPKHFLGVD